VIARYIPGGRTAATLTAGTVGYPLRRFTFFDAIAASSWATYSALIGFVGGASFEDDPLKGLVFGLGIAFGISVAVEVVRAVRRRTGRGRVVTGNDTEVVPERQIG
jgi:membrane protein DedA with SNARE-associated domain